MAEGFSGEIVHRIVVEVAGAGGQGGGGGGGPVVPGGGGPARPEGTSPGGGGNKASRSGRDRFGESRRLQDFLESRSDQARAEDDKFQTFLENQQKIEGNKRARIAARQAERQRAAEQRAQEQHRFNEQVAARVEQPMTAAGVARIRAGAKVSSAARSVQREIERGEARDASARLMQEQEKMTPLAAAMDRMTGFFQQLMGGTSSAAQRSAVQSGSLSGLAKGFIFGGIGRNLASSAVAGLDPGANSAQVGADTAKGLVGAGLQIGGMAVSAAMKMGGLPGFMVGTAISGIANQAIDAVAGPDIRKSQTAADMISNEIMASHRAGVQISPQRLDRVASVANQAAEMTEDAKQAGVKLGLANRLRSGKTTAMDAFSVFWHDPVGATVGLVNPFYWGQGGNDWIADRIRADVIDRVRPATRDAAFESPSSH